MRALTYQGRRSVSVETVPDPAITAPTDAIIRVTSAAICGSDLHLYELFGPFLDRGDVLAHDRGGRLGHVLLDQGADRGAELHVAHQGQGEGRGGAALLEPQGDRLHRRDDVERALGVGADLRLADPDLKQSNYTIFGIVCEVAFTACRLRKFSLILSLL